MPDMGCASPSPWVPSDGVMRIVRRAQEEVRARANPEAMHAMAVVDLLADPGSGKSMERSIQALWTVARTSDSPGAAWADLSGAYLIRAERGGAPRDLLLAVEAAERALQQAPRNRTALFNRALGLQRFGLPDVAAWAWREYIEVDASSPWAAEAHRRLRVATTEPAATPPPRPDASLTAFGQFARTDPQAARLLGQDRLLEDWAKAVLSGQPARANALLQRAGALGDALRQRPGGDQTLSEAVQAIRAQVGGPDLRRLAEAHREYATGRALYDSTRHASAEPHMKAAAAGGSPALRGWAELFVANIGVLSRDWRAAEPVFLELATRTDTLRYPALAARVRWSIAATRVRTERYELALEPAAASARLFARAGEREYAAAVLSILAEAQAHLGESDQAYATWHRALEALRPYRNSDRLHGLLVAVATAAADDGLHRAAVRLADDGVEVTRRRGEAVYAVEARLARARLLPGAGEVIRAVEDMDSARVALGRVSLDQTPRMRTELQVADGLTSLFSRPAHPGRAAAALDSAAAFFSATGLPLRSFPIVVSAAEARLALGDLPGATARMESAFAMLGLRRDSIRLEPRRAAVFNDARGVVDRVVMLNLAAGRRAEALRFLDLGRASLAPSDPEPAASRAPVIKGPLGEVGVEYALVRDTLVAFTVSGRQVSAVRTLVDTVQLVSTVTRLLQLLQGRGDDPEVDSLLARLHGWLVGPIQPHLGPAGTTLVLVADGTLAQVPWSALRKPAGRYLVQDHPLRFAVSLHEAWRPRPAAAGRDAVLVADPAFDPVEEPGLQRLRGATAEVDAIRREYLAARVLPGAAATGAAVRDALSHAGMVHYAGHAVFDDERPERSYLVLAPVRGLPGSGRLTAGELAGLDLGQAPLVVLAACSTVNAGRGRADGFSGLAGGLLAAGARGVVGGLWEVDDARTQPLMIAFHRTWRAEGDGARALRMAQLQLLASADPVLRSPAAWAGFRYAGR